MREYLSDLEPEEVTERIRKGEKVYYKDTRGKQYSYKLINGIVVRYNDEGEPDGYGRSIYSTGEAYFDNTNINVLVGKHYRTRSGNIAYIVRTAGKWFEGDLYKPTKTLTALSWTSKGKFIDDCIEDDNDLVMELD